jgi:glycosyltransferase involved in cell wall biosynthesis
LTPELYKSKYGLTPGGFTMRALQAVEGIATTRVADHVVTSSEAFARRLVGRGVPQAKITVVVNSADPKIFDWRGPRRDRQPADDFVLFWHGSVVKRYGLDLAIAAVKQLEEQVPRIRLRIYGEGEFLSTIEGMVKALELEHRITFGGHVTHEEIPVLCKDVDLGVVPNRPDEHIDLAFPTKLFEFVATGVPVVATRTPILESVFGDDAILFCDATATSIAERVLWAYEHPHQAAVVATRALEAYGPVEWSRMKRTYLELVSELTRAHANGVRGEAARLADTEGAGSA